jgi:DNA-binding response OmpR family regulator
MTLQALLFSTDDTASAVVGQALPACGIAVERCSDSATAISRMHQQKFDALVLDFDDAQGAAEVLQESAGLIAGNAAVTVALLSDAASVRNVLNAGAHFVLYKPISESKAMAALRAVSALLTRERRRAFRVPVQAPVELTLPDARKIEGILLDLSETGMDVLTAEPQSPQALIGFRFQLPDGTLEIEARGQVAWANVNGQTGVHFLDLDETSNTGLKTWLQAAASVGSDPNESVPHCKLTDLSLGGCYVETDSPFPEHALVDLCLKTGQIEVHIEGMVRVLHPEYGMGVEFPSRTSEQRAQVGNLIDALRSSPQAKPELLISPQALLADPRQFHAENSSADQPDEIYDPLLELLRQGVNLPQERFLALLKKQRGGESVAAATS